MNVYFYTPIHKHIHTLATLTITAPFLRLYINSLFTIPKLSEF